MEALCSSIRQTVKPNCFPNTILFWRKTFKYGTFCCKNLDSAQKKIAHLLWAGSAFYPSLSIHEQNVTEIETFSLNWFPKQNWNRYFTETVDSTKFGKIPPVHWNVFFSKKKTWYERMLRRIALLRVLSPQNQRKTTFKLPNVSPEVSQDCI